MKMFPNESITLHSTRSTYVTGGGAVFPGGDGQDHWQLEGSPGTAARGDHGRWGLLPNGCLSVKYHNFRCTQSIKSALEAAISATESKLARRAEIREKKVGERNRTPCC